MINFIADVEKDIEPLYSKHVYILCVKNIAIGIDDWK